MYTPTAGLPCQNYSVMFRRPRGMYFNAQDRGEMMSLVYNWPAKQVDMIVVTDGSRILGLGDLRVQGIEISIGKLDLYVAAAGINPQRVLPVMIDVGANNEKASQRSCVLGIATKPPFISTGTVKLLSCYSCCYGLNCPFLFIWIDTNELCLSSLKISRPSGPLNCCTATEIRIECSMMVFRNFLPRNVLISIQMHCHLQGQSKNLVPWGYNQEQASRCVHVAVQVHQVKPGMLIGLSAVGGLFSYFQLRFCVLVTDVIHQQVLEALKGSTLPRPAIFAMSNPTKNAECTADKAFSVLGGDIIFASGSPF
ncbi:hypothetical protein C5167_030259 [Papaver somniferum]|nr:hypothetical protein C5167_030259 [Papaver somniferum]